MIYRVVLDGVDIYGVGSEHQLIKGTADLELNGAGSCDLVMPFEHEAYDLPRSMKSVVDIYENDTIVWFGRVTDLSINWNNEKKVSAEGALAYFNDSIIRPYSWDEVFVTSFFEDLINRHNEQVSAEKQFIVGNIDDFAGIKVTRTVNYEKTFDVLQEQCIKACGGYIMLRKEPDGEGGFNQYIDWYKEIPYNCAQEVAFGINLLDMSSNLVSNDILTAVIPLGDDGNGGKITIEGLVTELEPGYAISGDYIYNIEAAEEFGLILEVVEFNDVTNPLVLADQGVQYLKSKQFDHISFECNVAELKYLDADTDAFNIGQNVRVVSNPHFIDKTLAISKISYDISNATKKVTIGTPPRQDISQITASEGGSSSGTVISGGGGSGGGGGGGGGGSVVSVRPIILTGDNIATITVNGRVFYLRYDASSKADADTVYTKTEMDAALNLKADSSSVYSKSEVYNKTETYTKQEVYNKEEIYTKQEVYNKTETYTKQEVDDAIEDAAYALPIASDEILGGVKVGETLTIDEEGVLDTKTPVDITVIPEYQTGSLLATVEINDNPPILIKYDLPIASSASLGGIKVGDFVDFDESTGELSGIRTIYTGTSVPNRNIGNTGDIYVQYEWIADDTRHLDHYTARFVRSYTKMPTGDAESYDVDYTEWIETSTGNAITYGMDPPGDAVGKNGDIHLQYRIVQEEYEDPYLVVSELYQRIEGSWARFDTITWDQLEEETYKVKNKQLLLYNHNKISVKSDTVNEYTRIKILEHDFVMENRSPLSFDFELNMNVVCDSYHVVPLEPYSSQSKYIIYGDTTARIVYRLNLEEFNYTPEQVLRDGPNVLSLHYPISVLEKQAHTFIMYLEIKNGEITIPIRNFIGTITGTGIDADGFSGVLKVSDDILPYNPNVFYEITDSIDEDLLIPVTDNVSDNVAVLNFGSIFSGYSDVATVTEEEGE